jgi:hypothetical protein
MTKAPKCRAADDLLTETVMPVLSPQVRYEGMNGPSSVAVRGPSLTLNRNQAAIWGGAFHVAGHLGG